MYNTETCFTITCDNCKDLYCDENGSGFSLFGDTDQAWECAESDAWYEQDGKHYCASCYKLNDDGTITLNEKRTK